MRSLGTFGYALIKPKTNERFSPLVILDVIEWSISKDQPIPFSGHLMTPSEIDERVRQIKTALTKSLRARRVNYPPYTAA